MAIRADKPLSPAESRAAAASAWRVAFWGVGIYALARIASLLLESMSMPAAVAQAVIAEWGTGRLGVAWSDPTQPVPTTAAIARRAGIGAGVGVIAAAVVVGFLATTRAVILERATPATSAIIVAIITAGFYAMRDELLLHGLVQFALDRAKFGIGGRNEPRPGGAQLGNLGAEPLRLAALRVRLLGFQGDRPPRSGSPDCPSQAPDRQVGHHPSDGVAASHHKCLPPP